MEVAMRRSHEMTTTNKALKIILRVSLGCERLFIINFSIKHIEIKYIT